MKHILVARRETKECNVGDLYNQSIRRFAAKALSDVVRQCFGPPFEANLKSREGARGIQPRQNAP